MLKYSTWFTDKSFAVNAARLWNDLPETIRHAKPCLYLKRRIIICHYNYVLYLKYMKFSCCGVYYQTHPKRLEPKLRNIHKKKRIDVSTSSTWIRREWVSRNWRINKNVKNLTYPNGDGIRRRVNNIIHQMSSCAGQSHCKKNDNLTCIGIVSSFRGSP